MTGVQTCALPIFSKPLRISVTLGELDDSLKTLDGYRLYVRRFNPKFKKIEEEPDHDLETVLSVELTVRNSLEAEWPLVSERAKAGSLEFGGGGSGEDAIRLRRSTVNMP